VARDPLPRFHKLFALASKEDDDGERASARRRVVELVDNHSSVNWLSLVPRAHRSWAFSPVGPRQEDCRTCYFLMHDPNSAFCMRLPPDTSTSFRQVFDGLSWCGEWSLHPDCGPSDDPV